GDRRHRPACAQGLERQLRRARAERARRVAARPGRRQARPRRRLGEDLLHAAVAKHAGRLLRRSALSRQSEFRRLEADRLPGPSLQLRQRHPPLRRALPVADGGADGTRSLQATEGAAVSTKMPPVDVVLVGFGWTAAIMGQELTDAGLNVLALERGGWRDTSTDFAVTFAQDELRYMERKALFQEPARDTLTFRNSPSESALPMRHLGSFLPATGVGGAGIHWNGQNWRFLPSDFVAR